MKIITGIASTTHVDAHHDRFTRGALESGVEQIRSRFIPFLIDHDPNQQLGTVLYGKCEPLPDGEFALFVVIGIFDNEEEKRCYANGSANTVWQDHVHHLDALGDELEKRRAQDRKQGRDQVAKYNPDNIAALLETHLDSTSIWIDGSVYKIKHLVASTSDLEVHVYPKDREPAHFHVLSKQRDIDVRFDLNTILPIKASDTPITGRDIKKIKNFFESFPDKLQRLRDKHARMQR
jgi:hypothetical protein